MHPTQPDHHPLPLDEALRRISDDEKTRVILADKRAWVAIWGADTDYLPDVADALAGELNNPWRG